MYKATVWDREREGKRKREREREVKGMRGNGRRLCVACVHTWQCGTVQDALGKLGNVIKKTLAAKKSADATGPQITKLMYNDNKYTNMRALTGKSKKSVKVIYTRTSSKPMRRR